MKGIVVWTVQVLWTLELIYKGRGAKNLDGVGDCLELKTVEYLVRLVSSSENAGRLSVSNHLKTDTHIIKLSCQNIS